MAGACVRKPNITLNMMIQRLIIGLLFFYSAMVQTTEKTPQESIQKDCVVLLHGLARTAFSMRKIKTALNADDYQVVNESYPSRKYPIETLADLAVEPAVESCANAPKIHFVTHSLGGILVRQYLSQHTIENLGNVVMLGPPNNGSAVVDYFQSSKLPNWLFDKANGPAGGQLGTGTESKPLKLGPVDFNLGVIAGNVSYSPLFSQALDGEDDGKVSVNSTQIEGMKDHITLPVSHTFMMDNDEVINQVSFFLKHGVFKKKD